MSHEQEPLKQPYEFDTDSDEAVPWLVLLVFAVLLWGGVWWFTR